MCSGALPTSAVIRKNTLDRGFAMPGHRGISCCCLPWKVISLTNYNTLLFSWLVRKGRCAAAAAAIVARCWPPKCSFRKEQSPHLAFKCIRLFQIPIDEYEFSWNLQVNNVCEKRWKGLTSPKRGCRRRPSSHLVVPQMSQNCPAHSGRVKGSVPSCHFSPHSWYTDITLCKSLVPLLPVFYATALCSTDN